MLNMAPTIYVYLSKSKVKFFNNINRFCYLALAIYKQLCMISHSILTLNSMKTGTIFSPKFTQEKTKITQPLSD